MSISLQQKETQLLISVRSVQEAHEALAGGADIIDIKDPNRGSLGQASSEVIDSIHQQLPLSIPLSLALGEWYHPRTPLNPGRAQWVKVGLSGLINSATRYRAQSTWIRLQTSVLPSRLVGVVYADQRRSKSIGFSTMLDWVTATQPLTSQPAGILIDTFLKDGKGLLHWLSMEQLRHWQRRCQSRGVFLALAGSLTSCDVSALMKHARPDVIAVRGAACEGGARTSSVQADRVRSLLQCLRAGS